MNLHPIYLQSHCKCQGGKNFVIRKKIIDFFTNGLKHISNFLELSLFLANFIIFLLIFFLHLQVKNVFYNTLFLPAFSVISM